MRSYDKITTLYERLSRDDELQGDSNSCGSYKFEGCIKLKGLQAVAQFDELSTILNRYFVEHHQRMPEIKYQVLPR